MRRVLGEARMLRKILPIQLPICFWGTLRFCGTAGGTFASIDVRGTDAEGRSREIQHASALELVVAVRSHAERSPALQRERHGAEPVVENLAPAKISHRN